ncbi:sigma-70 family RNA polymerase sigma factor [Tenacibaculum mesophilum]|uniref:Sigma-70 family RNA polymerase sigma factor n=1 Tax=Tenacibaculum mesophilum TaxID=104268 RepID=A0AAE9MNP0_9FLAO|nr:hypothetical protein [Tenacibaculum mesophilum]UTD15408.1 sigma-70 family RNA polymerase sigma factor [Tenacibaculum mesophilum]
MSDWKKYEKESTIKLIRLFQNKETSVGVKDLIFITLCYRFRKDVLEKCEVICKRFKHEVFVAELIADKTFESYYKKGKFIIKEESIEDVDNLFKFYLYGIAKNELTNYYRQEERKRKGHYYEGDERIVTDLENIDGMALDLKNKILIKAIESLTPNQRAVYLTYKKYEISGCNLPKNLLIELREYLGNVKQSRVRGLKKEANDRISIYLEALKVTQNISDE